MPGQQYLLGSDDLYTYVLEHHLSNRAGRPPPKETLRGLADDRGEQMPARTVADCG